MSEKGKKDSKAKVHDELSGFDIKISTFGELKTNISIDKLNEFLDENVNDKRIQEEE